MTDLKIVPLFDGPSMADIAGMARQFADDLEAGRYEGAKGAFIVLDCGDDVKKFGWGELGDTTRIIGLLARAQHDMSATKHSR